MRRATALAAALGVAACGPTHLEEGPVRTISCSDGDGGTGDLRLMVRRQGREVVVRHGSDAYRLRYRRTRNLFIDEYAGDGARLTADPEVFLHRPDGQRLGPCGF